MEIGFALLLLLGANGAPILAARLFAQRWNAPLDGGLRFVDGRALLGSAKTVRGVLAAIAVCPLIAWLAGLPAMVGVAFALYAMLGDVFSSFIKRRLGIPPSGQALGLDQIPEALIPLWFLREPIGLETGEVAGLTLSFIVVELMLSRLLYRWHIRRRPY